MRRLLVIAMVYFAASAAPASGQALLPSSFAGWSASGPSAIVPAGISSKGRASAPSPEFNQAVGADSAILREYFPLSMERRSYSQDARMATVSVLRLRDPSSAYGAYTLLRNDSLTPVSLGSFASASADRALIVVGNFFLDVQGTTGARPSDADLKQLADGLNTRADHTPYPTIGEHLPTKNLVRRSEHYVLGPLGLSRYLPVGTPVATDDWLGFDHSAEAVAARYRVQGQDLTLLIVSYPTQQIAADRFAAMLRRFTFDPPGTVPPDQTVLFGKRSSSIVAIVMGAPSRQAANTLLDQIRYESQVTWDEPKHTLTDPSINVMIIGAFLGTGAIMVLAIVAGISYGGFRVLVKFFFPNKVFDREKQVEILQLGISSKPIRAKDFY